MKKRSICYFIMISVVLFCSLHILAAEDIKVDSIRFDPVTATVDIRGGCPAAKDQEQVLLEIFLNAQTAHSFVAQTVCMNGSFAFLDCKLPSDTEPGAYTVRVSRMFGGESVVEDAFFYGGEEAVLDLINIIDQEMSPERLYALILDNYQVLGGDAEALYRQVTTKSLLFEEIISEDLNADKNNLPEKWRRFLDLLNYGTVITAISDSINANQIQTIIENPIYAAYADLDIAGSDGFHIYASLTDTGRAEAYRLLAKSTLTSLAEMNDELRKKCFVAHLRIGRYTDGEKAFLAVKDILNTNFSNYNLLTAEQKNEVLRKTAEYAKAIDDPYAISSYFEKEAEKAYQTKGQGTDGKTSHSSSGSSGGVNAAGGYPPQTAEPDNAANENISGFQDIQNVEWAQEAILALANKGVISGVDENRFEPDAYVTRAQLCRLVSICFGIQQQSPEVSFVDVDPTAWYGPAVNALASAGIVYGVGENKFAPDAYVTRQDLAVILCRTIDCMEIQIPWFKDAEKFLDDQDIAEYARDSVYRLNSYGFLNGDGENVNPSEHATRAQTALLLYNIEVVRWQEN